MRTGFCLSLPAIAVLALALLTISAAPEQRKIRLELERFDKGGWASVDPGRVLDQGDRVRFRFQSSFTGYLYVVNLASSGQYTTLFPSAETGTQNAVRAGEVTQIPSGNLDFRISGPPGQETVYWIMSPVELPGYGTLMRKKIRPSPATLVPRCDDTTLRVRGECVDATAGARELDPRTELPEPGKTGGGNAPPLTFFRDNKSSVVASNAAPGAPIVYEFRIAHK